MIADRESVPLPLKRLAPGPHLPGVLLFQASTNLSQTVDTAEFRLSGQRHNRGTNFTIAMTVELCNKRRATRERVIISISGDEIILEGVTVARFTPAAWPTLRDRAELILDGAEPDTISRKDHIEACEAARDEGFDQGQAEESRKSKAANEKACDEAYDEGFDQGQADALTNMEHAQDVVRVEKLLQAVSAAHDALFSVVSKRYPACKLSELRRQTISSLSAIRLAINAWRRS